MSAYLRAESVICLYLGPWCLLSEGSPQKDVTHEPGAGDQKLLSPSTVLGMGVLLASPAPRGCSTDTASR